MTLPFNLALGSILLPLLKVLQKETGLVTWCKANPSKKDKGEQAFREHSPRIFMGKCKELKSDSKSLEESSGVKHVTRARGWWKRGDVSACAAQANMECWVHHDIILDDHDVYGQG